MSLVIDEHRQYLDDRPRVDAYAAAIAAVVKPGDVVVDLGAGTGILGLLACRAGAARVYAIEADSIAGLTRTLAADNGYADRVVIVRELSTRAQLPERADVIVTDQVGAFGFDAGYLEFVADAYRRLLRPGGRTIPARVALEICPCEAPAIAEWVDFWASAPAGFDFSAVRPMAASTGYRATLGGDALVADPCQAALLEPAAGPSPRLRATCEFVVARDATLHGVAGWFRGHLAPGIELTNKPGHPSRVTRRHVVFPLETAVTVSEGDRVSVELHIWPADVFVSWEVSIQRAAEAAPQRLPRRSTLGGMLLSREDLAHTRNDAHPRLTAAGRARLTVLTLADGTRSLETIESLVAERHADILPTRDAAAAFVAEVLTRYAE